MQLDAFTAAAAAAAAWHSAVAQQLLHTVRWYQTHNADPLLLYSLEMALASGRSCLATAAALASGHLMSRLLTRGEWGSAVCSGSTAESDPLLT
jgi:hypothetical protein